MRYLLLGGVFVMFLNACTTNTSVQNPDSTSISLDTGIVYAEDWECIPGEKAGIITDTASEQFLINALGRQNVSPHDTVYGAEGMFSIGTILYKGTPNEAHITWNDTLNFKNPAYVEVGFADLNKLNKVKWYTTTGVKIGTKLTELERINGKSFNFSGFGWDYGGSVVDWNGGKLMNADSTSYLSVILGYDYDDQALNSVVDKLLGDSSFESKNPNAQKLNPHVAHLIISFK